MSPKGEMNKASSMRALSNEALEAAMREALAPLIEFLEEAKKN